MSKNKIMYGIPHCHSSISTGNASPEKIFKTSSKNKIDFIIITDHSKFLTKEIWNDLNNSLSNYKKLNSKCLFGFEVETFLGHINIIGSNTIPYYIKDIDSLFNFSKNNPNSIITLNHPSKKLLKIDYSSKIDNSIDLIEVGNGTKKYKDYEDIYISMLKKGFHFGAINGQDNHRLNMQKYSNFTGIILKKHDTSILDSLKNKSVFSTSSISLKLNFSIDDFSMGSFISYTKDINIKIDINDKKESISFVQLISNIGIINEWKFRNKKKFQEKFMLSYNDSINFIYLKIIYEKVKNTITSPIFLESNKLNN